MTEEIEKIDARIKNLESLVTVQTHKINILTSRLALVEMGLKALGKKFKMETV